MAKMQMETEVLEWRWACIKACQYIKVVFHRRQEIIPLCENNHEYRRDPPHLPSILGSRRSFQ